jgi:hypothetical protein
MTEGREGRWIGILLNLFHRVVDFESFSNPTRPLKSDFIIHQADMIVKKKS